MVCSLICAVLSAAFAEGERVAFFGDSISQNGYQTFQIQLFQTLRHPGKPVRIENIGTSGDTASGGLDRWDWDAKPYDPETVFVMFGMNDFGLNNWKSVWPTDAKNAAVRERSLAAYRTAMAKLVERIGGEGRRVVLLTPTPYDSYRTEEGGQWNRGADYGLSCCAEIVRALGREKNVPVIDLHGPLSAFYATHVDLKLNSDRIHPGPAGSLLMSTLIWRALGETNAIGRLELDAGGSGTVSVDYAPNALPFPDAPEYRMMAEGWPLLRELNREELVVKNLPAGRYALKANGKGLAECSSEELADGVSLATLETPNLLLARNAHEVACRLQRLVEQMRSVRIYAHEAETKGVDVDDAVQLKAWIDAELKKSESSPYGSWRRHCLGLLAKHYPARRERNAELDGYRAELNAVRPVAWRLEIVPTGLTGARHD